MKALKLIIFSFVAAACVMVFSGCSSEAAKAAAPQTGAKTSAKSAATTAEPVAEITPKSVFTTDRTARDPFFPKARVAEPDNSQPDVALDVRAILQANFHGVVSSGGKSIAFVNNIMLEEGRHAVIPIRAGGHERQVAVRCQTVTKDSVVLEVQGDPEPLRLTRVGR
jgi:hypothetical protein